MIDPQLTFEQAARLAEQFEQQERADIRRITFLTGWTIVLLYLLCDLVLRWGFERDYGWANTISSILAAPTPLIVVCLIGILLLWLLFYAFDTAIEQAGPASWLYRLGNLSHARLFCTACLLALIGSMMVAFQYAVTSPSFWLLAGVLAVVMFISILDQPGGAMQQADLAGARLRLLLRRVPIVGRIVRVRAPIIPDPESGPTLAAAAAASPDPSLAAAPTPDTTTPPDSAPAAAPPSQNEGTPPTTTNTQP